MTQIKYKLSRPDKNAILHSGKLYLNQTQQAEIPRDRSDVISGCFNYLALIDNSENINRSENCFAVSLALIVIDSIKKEKIKFAGRSFPESFYDNIVDELMATGAVEHVNDPELLTIYLKQAVGIMKSAGIIALENGFASLSREKYSDKALYMELFSSFWNHVKWEDIFPSDISAAKELKRNKSIFKDILLRSTGRMNLRDISNDFFELTGFSTENNMFSISFIDFYLMTWFKHFGIIKYSSGTATSPVYVELTENGRRLLKSF